MLERIGPVLGRALIALIFVRSGFRKLLDLAGTAEGMAERGIPAALAGAILAGVLEFAGGLALALGFKARWAALALFVFLIPVTWIYHGPFDPAQIGAFFKNLAIMGGLLLVASWKESASG